jgi:hypothetical protein
MRRLSALVGESATTTLTTLGLVQGNIENIELIARNFASSAVALGVLFNPYLVVLKTDDDLASITDYSDTAQDEDAATDVVLSSLSTLANGDYLLVGSHLPFAGVKVDVDAANGTASVLTVKYWNGSAWTDISDTDGTISSGKTMAQDGSVTWTIPDAWVQVNLVAPSPVNPQVTSSLQDEQAARTVLGNYATQLFWTRWEVSVALDSDTTLNSMHAINRSTNYRALITGQIIRQAAKVGFGKYGSIQHVTNTGTANLIVNGGSGRNEF